MWLKCQGLGLYSLLRLRRQRPVCMLELQVMANSDLGLFQKKRELGSVVSLWQIAPRMKRGIEYKSLSLTWGLGMYCH